jgi:bacteriorhodopsin
VCWQTGSFQEGVHVMPLFILILVVIIAGVAIALRSATVQGTSSSALGLWCFVCGLVAAAGVAMIGTLSLKRNSGRMLGITGLALTVLSVGAFFAMAASVDY